MAGDERRLIMSLADMARDLLAQPTVQATLDWIASHAVTLVPGCQAAGIISVDRGRLRTLAATDDVVRAADRMQQESGEGPCLDAVKEHTGLYRVQDLTTRQDRWPIFAPQACEVGVGSMVGFLLYTHERTLGALNVYSPRPGAFDEESEHVGWVLAAHAAVAVANARTDASLQAAIGTRQVIGEALGIIMERHDLSEEGAFELLTRVSQDHNIKVRDLAQTIVRTGEIPASKP